jgi:predicted NBD/HSP70 family sugar kinase
MTAGIDVGGTKVRWLILDRKYRVVKAREAKTPLARGRFETFFKTILSDLGKKGIHTIGVGAPGSISGTVLRSARNLPAITPLDFKKLVPAGFSFRLDNDARCFTRAEAYLGAGKDSRKVLGITIGTGIGRALAINKQVVSLKRLERAETWEPAYQQRADKAASSLSVFLARKLAPLIFEVEPDFVVVGGGRFRTKALFKLLHHELRKYGVACPVRYSRFRKNAAAIGAAILMAAKS